MDVEAVADELYGLDPADFIARRTALVAEARTAGERELARTIATLRRPPLAAWLLNQLLRSEPDVFDALSDFAQRIRHAHRALEGDQLRVLAGERQQVLDRVVDAVIRLASARDVSVTDAVRLQIRATAEAAIADEAAEAAVLSGRLTDVLSYSGFGEVDVSDAVAVGLPSRPRRRPPPHRPTAVPDAVDRSATRSGASDRSAPGRAVASDRSASGSSAADSSAVAQRSAARAEAQAAQDAEDLSIAAAESAAAAAERDDAERTFASATARLQELEAAVVQARSALRAATSARTAATRKAERAELRRLALERRQAKAGGR